MILIDILEEHMEEADFLWQQRQNALYDRVYNLDDLAELEERLLAHLDGLVLGEKEAWKLLGPKLSSGEEGEVFSAAFVALDSRDPSKIDLVNKTFLEAEDNVLNGICYAFKHTMNQEVENILRSMLNSDNGRIQAASIDCLSLRRISIDTNRLQAFLSKKDTRIIAATVSAVGRLRINQLSEEAERFLENEIMEVRREAIKTGLLLGSRKSLDACRRIIINRTEGADQLIEYLGLMGQPDDANILINTMNDPGLVRNAITALGLLGNISTVELLIQSASDPKLSRLAGEAISRITGVDIVSEKFVAEKPVESQIPSSETEEEEEEDLSDPDEDIPFPDVEKLKGWWRSNASRYDKRVRYRNGQPYSNQVLKEILKNGNLPARHHAAFEIALLNPSSPYLETHAFSTLQRNYA